MEVVIKGITEDRKRLVLSVNGVGITASRDFTEQFTAMDIRTIVGEPDKPIRIPVLRMVWASVTGAGPLVCVPMYRQVDTLTITKL